MQRGLYAFDLESDYADRAPEIESHEIDIFVSKLKSELESNGWRKIHSLNDEFIAWVNIESICSKLEEFGPKMTEQEFRATALKLLFDSVPAAPVSDPLIVDGYLHMISRWLKEQKGCEPLVLDGEKWIYTSNDLFEAERSIYSCPHISVAENLSDASPEEVQSALEYYRINKDILAFFYDNRYTVGKKIKGMMNRKQADTIFDNLENAHEGDAEFETEATYTAKDRPTAYDVARQLEQQVELESQDEDDDDTDPGTAGYQVM